jgi:polyhydroxyalkanoate synthase
MGTSTAIAAPEQSLIERLRSEVERAIQRNLKGFEFLGSQAPPVGPTPKTLLHRNGTLSLYHYRATASEVYRVPILLVMATTNKAYIFDLGPGQSLIEFLLARGYDVYVMDWNAPTDAERKLKLEDYTLAFIPECVRRVQKGSGVEDVTVIGYCMGGVLATIYAALHADGPLKNLVCFTTPIDFKKMALWQTWADKKHFDVDRLVDSVGNIQPDFIIGAFDMLRPATVVGGKMKLWDNLWNDDYVKSYRMMDRWTAETLPLPGEYFRQVVKELLRKNGLCDGGLRIGGRLVDLRQIEAPLLHVIAANDHIVPPACAAPLVACAGSRDKEEMLLPGGHVSLVAGPNAVKRMWPKLDQWLGRRST